MDVNRENFSEVYPKLREKILSATIISFDEEMTGIMSADFKARNKKSDSPDDRYNKMKPVATKYGIIQFGICIYNIVPKPDGSLSIEASPYNFYLFPDSDQDIVLSASSVDFLRKNGMDFGTWISKGLTYANADYEEQLRKKYIEPHEKKEDASSAPVPATQGYGIVLTRQNDIDFKTRNVEKLKAFIADADSTEFHFENSNGFLKKALYEYMEKEHPNLTVSRAADGRICVTKLTDEQKAAHAKKLYEEDQKKYENAMGFRLVFKDIIESKKTIVGHNLMFDLMFMMKAFDGPLAEDLQSFKQRLHEFFPEIYDTKWIACSGVLGSIYDDTALIDIYNRLVKNYDTIAAASASATATAAATVSAPAPADSDGNEVVAEKQEEPVQEKPKFVQLAAGFENVFGDEEQFHNAGYDAYCTGAVFCREILLAGGMDKLRDESNKKLFMMQSLYHMDLHPERPNGWIKIEGSIVYVGNFPENVKTDAIISVFTLAGIPHTSLEVIWIDGTSTFVAVKKDRKTQAAEASAKASAKASADASAEPVAEPSAEELAEAVIDKLAIPKGWEIITGAAYDARRRPPPQEPAVQPVESESAPASTASPGEGGGNILGWISRTVAAPFAGSKKRSAEEAEVQVSPTSPPVKRV